MTQAVTSGANTINAVAKGFNFAGVAIQLANTANNIININITAKQVGHTYFTPNSGSITLPEGATNLTFNDNSGVAHFDEKGLPGIRVHPQSLTGFDFDGKHYDAIHSYLDGSFVKYGWNYLYFDIGELDYKNSTVIQWSNVQIGMPDVREAAVAANMGIAIPAPVQAKVIATLAFAASAYVLSTIYWRYVFYEFNMTYPASPIGGYLYAEKTLNDLVPGSIKRSPSWDDSYGYKTPSEIEELAKQGDKIAQKMKKLWQQTKRLLEKNKNKGGR